MGGKGSAQSSQLQVLASLALLGSWRGTTAPQPASNACTVPLVEPLSLSGLEPCPWVDHPSMVHVAVSEALGSKALLGPSLDIGQLEV